MKLVTFEDHPKDRGPLLGAICEDGRILDLGACNTVFLGLSMLDVIRQADIHLPRIRKVLDGWRSAPPGAFAVEAGREPGPRDGLCVGTVLSPIPRPVSIRDGYAFRQHVETARRNRGLSMIPEFDLFPVFYFTNHLAVIGPGELRVGRERLSKLDFELECFAVIGKRITNPSLEEADDAIFGYGVMNDFSARTLQMEEMKLNLGPAKGKDFATGLGPWLVTKDELSSRLSESPKGRVLEARMTAEVNGVRVSDGNVADMNWTFAEIIKRAADGVTLEPGEIIGSGTVGTGCFLELNGSGLTKDQWLVPGDTISLSIEGLGTLTNWVVQDDTR